MEMFLVYLQAAMGLLGVLFLVSMALILLVHVSFSDVFKELKHSPFTWVEEIVISTKTDFAIHSGKTPKELVKGQWAWFIGFIVTFTLMFNGASGGSYGFAFCFVFSIAYIWFRVVPSLRAGAEKSPLTIEFALLFLGLVPMIILMAIRIVSST